jgi:MFS family permease
MAFLLYLDRVCLGEIVKGDLFLSEFKTSKIEVGRIMAAFFFTYALFQVPAGWLSDRFGARTMLTAYILGWSLFTGLTGFATTLTGLWLARLACGFAQAGAYPTSSGLIRKWFSVEQRGTASGMVSMGGRIGGAVAPILTAFLLIPLGNWRNVLYLYFALGVLVAWGYWAIVRSPSVTDTNSQPQPRLVDIGPMLLACCINRSLWLNSVSQFAVNVGWIFLVTWLPTFLKEKGIPTLTGATMVSIVLAVGIPGQVFGGWIGDRSVKKFGLRIGRVLVPALSAAVAGCAYIGCIAFDSVWIVVAMCALVSLCTDVGNPSSWAFMQDVGGRNTAAIHGWTNMWGNFGASFGAIIVPYLLNWGETSGNGQSMVFAACSGAFFLASIAMLGMDATRPVQAAD